MKLLERSYTSRFHNITPNNKLQKLVPSGILIWEKKIVGLHCTFLKAYLIDFFIIRISFVFVGKVLPASESSSV